MSSASREASSGPEPCDISIPSINDTDKKDVMRNLAVQMYMTVDGVMEAPDKWSNQYWTDKHESYAFERLSAADALLLGRSTYEQFAGAWPSRRDDPFADRMNSIPKYVVSSTLTDGDLTWHNSRLINGDVVGEVTRLKHQTGGDILLYGSDQLFNLLLDRQLIDDFRLWVFPVVLGSGGRLFHERNALHKLKLVDTTTFDTGVVILSYQPA
jgi:dihydrofolate reductase